MKKYILAFIGLMFNIMQSQTNKPEYERVYIEIGYLKPFDKLSNKFDISPSFGFWFRNRIQKNDYVDLGFNFFIPNNPSNINFKFQDTILSYKSRYFAINIGARFAKVLPLSLQTNNFNFEWNSGVGLALNTYKAPDEIDFGDDVNEWRNYVHEENIRDEERWIKKSEQEKHRKILVATMEKVFLDKMMKVN
jgi:hypothetical protein